MFTETMNIWEDYRKKRRCRKAPWRLTIFKYQRVGEEFVKEADKEQYEKLEKTKIGKCCQIECVRLFVNVCFCGKEQYPLLLIGEWGRGYLSLNTVFCNASRKMALGTDALQNAGFGGGSSTGI